MLRRSKNVRWLFTAESFHVGMLDWCFLGYVILAHQVRPEGVDDATVYRYHVHSSAVLFRMTDQTVPGSTRHVGSYATVHGSNAPSKQWGKAISAIWGELIVPHQQLLHFTYVYTRCSRCSRCTRIAVESNRGCYAGQNRFRRKRARRGGCVQEGAVSVPRDQ